MEKVNENVPPRVWIYARCPGSYTATKEQAEFLGLRARLSGATVVGISTDTKNGWHRPGYRELLHRMKQGSFNCIYIYLPESFEWLILQSGVIRSQTIQPILSSPSEYVESSEYFSWEQFFTDLLVTESNKMPYVINEDQAETVRMIFEQYATGEGLGKVAANLIAKGRKDGGGHLKWDSSKVTRILRNPTYMGYCVYNRTRTTDLLEHSREKNNDEETYILKKGNFPAIIDEELWHRCNDIRRSRHRYLLDENGKPRKYGGTIAKNVWVTKLVCSCGSKMRRYLWNTKTDGTHVWGFECYRHKKQSALYLKKHGLPEGVCERKAFPEWKLELMALKIFETVWGNRREAVLEACRMLNACYREESVDPAKLKALDKRLDALNQRLDNLIMMKASNQINLNQFMEQSNEIGVQQQRITKEKAELLAKQDGHKALDMDAIEASLCEAVEFTNGKVSDWFIQNFVRRITPIDDTRFAWVLDLAPEPQTLVCDVNGRKEYPRITLESNLYKGAWPSLEDLYHPFLLDGEGQLNGDISSSGLDHDRLQSRIPTSERVAIYMVKITPNISRVEMLGVIFILCSIHSGELKPIYLSNYTVFYEKSYLV